MATASKTSLGPIVIYGQFVAMLALNFFIFPALLLTGRQAEEDIWRRTGLQAMCIIVLLDLAWTNTHPQAFSLLQVAAAAGLSVCCHFLHLLLAFGVFVGAYSYTTAMALQFGTGLPWIFVSQVGTEFVVATGRSPARFQILAWITVMFLGTMVTVYPAMRESTWLVIAIAGLPRLVVCLALVWEASVGVVQRGEAAEASGDSSYSVALPRAARFAVFACNGSTGEALNDMATDLKIRRALTAGDTQMTVTYNLAVVLSMFGGYVSESFAAGKEGPRRMFSVLWFCSQVFRSVGMDFLTPDRNWLMFTFVFMDKFTGPLGQAAIDTALLAVMRRGRDEGRGSSPGPRLPANALWTVRTAAERLERPACQLLLLTLQVDRAPVWLPVSAALVATAFVQFTLRPAAEAKKLS